MKRLLKQKNGMTLMEILVALTLLMIVIVGTTPVMLSAFDGLYTAGEFTQDTYQAKSEVEDKLATRNTKDIYNPGFQVNFENIGEVANINARRAVSSLYGSVEALFSNGKVHVAVVSAKTVNDDLPTVASTNASDYYEVIIQTSNLDFGSDVKNKYDAAAKVSLNNESEVVDGDETREKIIDLTFIIPNKQADGEAAIYTYKDDPDTPEDDKGQIANIYRDAEGNECEADPVTGRITVRINGFDFTQSPIKIYVSYLDENNDKQVTHTYLFIDQPTIIAAGETGTNDYYTTPGVVTKKVKDANGNVSETTEFGVYGRTMRIDEIAFRDVVEGEMQSEGIVIMSGVSRIPSGTIIRSVNWITEDQTTGLKPYYVMTGTNGAIYRTYAFKGSNASLEDLIDVQDKSYSLKDKTSTYVYPALWGGDQAQQFGYSTFGDDMGYGGGDWCWYTEDEDNHGYADSRSIAYSTKASFAYYFNGYGQSYSFDTQRSRKISYILTEVGHAIRLGGVMKAIDNFGQNYNKIWEKYDSRGTGTAWNEVSVQYTWGNNDMGKTSPIYGTSSLWAESAPSNSDRGFAPIRIKYLTTLSSTYIQSNERADADKKGNVRFLNDEKSDNTYINNTKITVTDAAYIPPSGVEGDTVTGKMVYVGTVAAYAYVNQMDNVNSSTANWLKKYDPRGDKFGWRTGYLVLGNDDSTATSVYKFASPNPASTDGNDNIYKDPYHALKKNKTQVSGDGYSTSSTEGKKFFVYRDSSSTTDAKGMLFNDLLFTMGYASSREMFYSEIVYGKLKDGNIYEAYKGCEPYYFLSRYGNKNVLPNFYMSKASGYVTGDDYFNSVDNDYYNAWFPGEMYNITKFATKDGITVGVGYAVAGSTYQFIDTKEDSNTSTALGGIFNDGVLSCLIGGQDTAMSNLLYYKDNISFDDYSLTLDSDDENYLGYDYKACNGTNYDGDNNGSKDYDLLDSGYGPHSRDSVQFTAVDIGVQRVVTDTTEKATYYAYYADNKGRVFRSKVADKSSSVPGDYDPDDENANQNVTVNSLKKVNYISDVIYNPPEGSTYQITSLPADENIGYMEQLQPDWTLSFDALFSKITTLKCEGNLVVVAGEPTAIADAYGIPVCIGMVDESTRKTTWTVVCFKPLEGDVGSSYKIQDILIKDGYIYAVGYCGSKGFTLATELAPLKSKLKTYHDLENPYSVNRVHAQYDAHIVKVPDKLYAIAGQ